MAKSTRRRPRPVKEFELDGASSARSFSGALKKKRPMVRKPSNKRGAVRGELSPR